MTPGRARGPRPAPPGRVRPPAAAGAPASWALALILAAAAWLHLPALRTPLFADDYLFLDQVRFRTLWGALASPDPLGNFVRPVGRQLYFWLGARLGGESALYFHVLNLVLFLGVITLLFRLVRRLAGAAAATVAAGFVALHYSADVLVLWASGGQDLLAVLGALGAMLLVMGGRPWLAGLSLLAALLSKETVVFAPLVAALATRRPREPWRASLMRLGPLALAVLAWAAIWLVSLSRSAAARGAVAVDAGGALAAFVHLVQVVPGAEWRQGGAGRFLAIVPPLIPLVLALTALAILAWGSGARSRPERDGPATQASPGVRPATLGALWAVLGAAPVAAVSSIWSAYYYLFALCGVGLALGAFLARRPRWLAVAVVALLAWGSQNGRRLDEFVTAPGAWTTQSHVNRFYLERAMKVSGRYLAQLKSAHPTLPPRSTIFFGGLPAWIALQSADGPVVRWAWRDSSLRSFYLMEFTRERFERGPAFAFVVEGGRLVEKTVDPEFMKSVAMRALVSDKPAVAGEVLDVLLERQPADAVAHYWRAWVAAARKDRATTAAHLRLAGMRPDPGPAPAVDVALAAIARGDTAGAGRLLLAAVREHALDARVHALLAAVLVNQPDGGTGAAVEAFAALSLEPGFARNWWLWGFIQARAGQQDEAVRSLTRFLSMGGDPDDVAEARELLGSLRTASPGGQLVQRGLREDIGAAP